MGNFPSNSLSRRDKNYETSSRSSDNMTSKKKDVEECKEHHKGTNENDRKRGAADNMKEYTKKKRKIVPQEIDNIKTLPEQFNFLMNEYPEADPTYLFYTLLRHTSGNLNLDETVSNDEENVSYMSYLRREKDRSSRYKYDYIHKLNVENFVKDFPDPVTYFHTKKFSENNDIVKEYLSLRYPYLRFKSIEVAFKKYNRNLSDTCDKLDRPAFSKTLEEKPYLVNYAKCSIPLIQEIAFVENREKIIQHLKKKDDERKIKLQNAKLRGLLVECACCYEDYLEEDTSSCTKGHTFCKICIRKICEIQFGKAITNFPCLDPNGCVGEFSMQTLHSILNSTLYDKIFKRKQYDEVLSANVEGLETCPRCYFATVPDCDVFYCMNPECLAETCRHCKETNHLPLKCEEVEETSVQVEMRTFIENRMSEAVLCKCYKCKKNIYKSSGCNYLMCTCGAASCFGCREPFQDCACAKKKMLISCPYKAGKEAKSEIMKRYPGINLKNDPTEQIKKQLKVKQNKQIFRRTI